MALPTITECKQYLRIEHADEDTLLTALLARALALVEAFLGYALTAAERTHVDYVESDNWGVQPVLRLPGPVKTAPPAPVVTDRDGATVDAATYYVDARAMKIRAMDGYSFPARPYTVVATIGLSVHPDYAAKLEAQVSLAIVELVAHLYQNRNPAATTEADEGGGSKSVATQAATQGVLPARIEESLSLLPRPHGMGLA